MELLSFAASESIAFTMLGIPKPETVFEIEYIAETHEPITPLGGPRMLPSKTFEEVGSKQFDIILIPGGKLSATLCQYPAGIRWL